MIRRPPRSTRTDTLFPDTALFRSTMAGRTVESDGNHAITLLREDARVPAGLPAVAEAALRPAMDDEGDRHLPGRVRGLEDHADRKSTRLNSSHACAPRMPYSA